MNSMYSMTSKLFLFSLFFKLGCICAFRRGFRRGKNRSPSVNVTNRCLLCSKKWWLNHWIKIKNGSGKKYIYLLLFHYVVKHQTEPLRLLFHIKNENAKHSIRKNLNQNIFRLDCFKFLITSQEVHTFLIKIK